MPLGGWPWLWRHWIVGSHKPASDLGHNISEKHRETQTLETSRHLDGIVWQTDQGPGSIVLVSFKRAWRCFATVLPALALCVSAWLCRLWYCRFLFASVILLPSPGGSKLLCGGGSKKPATDSRPREMFWTLDGLAWVYVGLLMLVCLLWGTVVSHYPGLVTVTKLQLDQSWCKITEVGHAENHGSLWHHKYPQNIHFIYRIFAVYTRHYPTNYLPRSILNWWVDTSYDSVFHKIGSCSQPLLVRSRPWDILESLLTFNKFILRWTGAMESKWIHIWIQWVQIIESIR